MKSPALATILAAFLLSDRPLKVSRLLTPSGVDSDAEWFVRESSGSGCGAALVGDRHALTAAHCLDENGEEWSQVHVGRENPVTAGVRGVCLHPDFPDKYQNDGNWRPYDLAVVLLDSKPGKTPLDYRARAAPDQKPYVYAWDYDDGDKVCRSNRSATVRKVSSGVVRTERRASKGESGAPLVLGDRHLLGVLSVVKQKADVYVHVPDRKNWLEKVIESADPLKEGLCAEP